MIDEMANHGNRIRRYMDRFGVDRVEDFIDACLTIEDLIDIHSPFIKRAGDADDRYRFADPTASKEETNGSQRFKAKPYMESFINPKRTATPEEAAPASPEVPTFPNEPVRDVMGFVEPRAAGALATRCSGDHP